MFLKKFQFPVIERASEVTKPYRYCETVMHVDSLSTYIAIKAKHTPSFAQSTSDNETPLHTRKQKCKQDGLQQRCKRQKDHLQPNHEYTESVAVKVMWFMCKGEGPLSHGMLKLRHRAWRGG